MPDYLSKEAFFEATKAPEEDYEQDGLRLRIRGVTFEEFHKILRTEAFEARQQGESSVQSMAIWLSAGLMEPKLNFQEAQNMLHAQGVQKLNPIIMRIRQLSDNLLAFLGLQSQEMTKVLDDAGVNAGTRERVLAGMGLGGEGGFPNLLAGSPASEPASNSSEDTPPNSEDSIGET